LQNVVNSINLYQGYKTSDEKRNYKINDTFITLVTGPFKKKYYPTVDAVLSDCSAVDNLST
jgi:hypothetical protein